MTEGPAMSTDLAREIGKALCMHPNDPRVLAVMEIVDTALRTAVAEAYEDAAKIAEDTYSDGRWNGYYRQAGLKVAAAIRSKAKPPATGEKG